MWFSFQVLFSHITQLPRFFPPSPSSTQITPPSFVMATIEPATGDSTSAGTANSPGFTKQITSIPENSRQLLEQYSHIPPDQVIPHIQELVGSCSLSTFSPRLTRLRQSAIGHTTLSPTHVSASCVSSTSILPHSPATAT